MGSMVYVRNDGPEPCEIRHPGGRVILRVGEEVRLYTKHVDVTPIRSKDLQDHLHYTPAREEPKDYRVGEE